MPAGQGWGSADAAAARGEAREKGKNERMSEIVELEGWMSTKQLQGSLILHPQFQQCCVGRDRNYWLHFTQ